MPVERGLRATSPVHVHVEDDIPVHVHVKQKGKKVTKKVYVIYTLASIKKKLLTDVHFVIKMIFLALFFRPVLE